MDANKDDGVLHLTHASRSKLVCKAGYKMDSGDRHPGCIIIYKIPLTDESTG